MNSISEPKEFRANEDEEERRNFGHEETKRKFYKQTVNNCSDSELIPIIKSFHRKIYCASFFSENVINVFGQPIVIEK